MFDQDEKISDELKHSVDAMVQHTEQVETMLLQTLEVLSRLGNAPAFNAETIVQQGRSQRYTLQQTTQRFTHQMQELTELVRTSALITTSLEIDRVLEEVIDTVITLTGAERAYLMLLKSEDDLHVMAARDKKQQDISVDDVTFSRGVIKAALEDGMPVISTNAQEDERFQNMQSVMRNDLRSIMVIPMMLQGVPLGVLYLDNRLAAAVFHKKSIPVLTAFANQAAISIENARLFERVQESLERTKREVKRLRIQLDQNKLSTQVIEITESDYFQHISSMAKDLRAERNR